MRSRSFWLLSFFLSAFSIEAVFAHDGWVEVPAIVETGQPVTFSLMLGNHSNDHKSYRLAGKWDLRFTKLLVIAPSGEVNDITTSLVDLGEDDEKTGPKGPKGFHIATFTPKSQGVHIVVAREEQVMQYGDGPKFRSVRSARGAFNAVPIPSVAQGKKSTGFGRTFAIENLMEIVPVTNPIGLMQNSPVTLELRYKGRPFPNQTITVVRRSDGPSSVRDFATDENGRLNFITGPADFYLVRAKFDEQKERSEGQYDLSSYQATYVLQVFNQHNASSF